MVHDEPNKQAYELRLLSTENVLAQGLRVQA